MTFSEFQNRPKRFSPLELRFIALVAAALLALLGVNLFLASILPAGGEFSLLREAGRAFLFERVEPYGPEIPARVQEEVYGRPARSGEQPYILDVPFHLLIPYFPFALSNEIVARGIFLFLLEAALVSMVYFGFKLSLWEPPRLFLLLFFAVSLLNYYSVNAFLNGSPVIFLGLAYAGTLMALRHRQDELAGALLSLACFQWEIGAPFLLLIIFYAFRTRRWQVLAGFGMLTVVLLAISYLWYPGWTIPFLRAAFNNMRAAFGFSTHDFIHQLIPAYANRISWAAAGLFAVILGYEWSKINERDFRRFFWTSCLTLSITPLLGFRLQPEQLVVLVLPLGLILEVMSDRWSRFGESLMFIFMLVFFAVPWILFIAGSHRLDVIGNILFISLPALMVVCLYWIRWWAIRPPRTWVDQIPDKK
jgi:hypothetical protein